MADPVIREFLLTFWKIHILHHAEEHGLYGQWMLEELRRHGYRLSPGTLYPLLARMAERGWLSAEKTKKAREARVYHITAEGAQVLKRLRVSLAELKSEVTPSRAASRRLRASTHQPKTAPQATSSLRKPGRKKSR
jgi:PadR family transcriptional regulator, regulatory protein PadR